MIENWQGEALILAIELGFTEANERANELIKVETEDNKWTWPRPTIRSDGTIAGSPRDVIDTGAFLESIDYVYTQLDEGEHRIDVPYALDVVLGVGDKPARNVFQIPIYERLFPEFLKKASENMDKVD